MNFEVMSSWPDELSARRCVDDKVPLDEMLRDEASLHL